MNKYLIIIAVVALAVFTACTNDEGQRPAVSGADQLPISLGSSYSEATRSNNATNLLNGDTVWVWTDMINGATQAVGEYFNAWALKANGVGGLSPLASGNTKLFPATNVLNFYALCGNFGKETQGERTGQPMIEAEVASFPSTGIRHTVLSDQTSPENYYKSDLLYAVVKNQEPVSQAVVLPFKHLLSRIQVVLVTGNNVTAADLSTATVKLLNLTRQVSFAPDKAGDFTDQSVLASMLGVPMNAQSGDILMSTNVVTSASDATAENSTVYADAIVVPQTIAKGTALIQVDYLGRTTYYRVPNGTGDSDFNIESGKQYRFRLIANRIGGTFEFTPVTVEEWGANTTTGLWLDNLTSTSPYSNN